MVDQGSDGLQDSTRAANSALGDRRSIGLQRNSEAENALKTWGNRSRKCFMQENNRHMSSQSSGDSISSEKSRDMVTGAKLTPHMVLQFLTGRPMQPRDLVLVGMSNRPSAQTLMVLPVSTTTLTFDGKSEKFANFLKIFFTQ